VSAPAPAVVDPIESAFPALAPRARRLGYALLAILAYLPAFLSNPGKVSADTKNYLYTDVDRLLERAPYLWDPNIGLGTVSHQNIGYLFPMGPFYWVLDKLGSPVWISQRLWIGSLLLLAGLGFLYLARTLGQRGPGMAVGAVVYMLTPYTLQYSSKHTIIVLPWVALPWMIAVVARALRHGGWKYPAVFAIIVQLAGSVNATALVLAGIAPALWVPYAVFVSREVEWRRALATVGRIGLLTVLASLWWMAGLWAQGSFGLEILRYTETLKTVSTTPTAPDTLRGLGYWFFYGKDKVSLWNDVSINYSQHLFTIATSFALPAFAMLSAAFVRWRHRVFFVAITIVGLAFSVGAYPYDDPSIFGGAFKSFAESSDAGMALRSSSRAAPLLILGLAMLLGVGVNALAQRLAQDGRARIGLGIAALVAAIAVANFAPFWGGSFYSSALVRDDIPQYWYDAIADVDGRPHDTRILEIPGADFSNYRWGGTVEPITPGLTDRPYVAREVVPWGSPASANLVDAFDRLLQERTLPPEAVPAFARLIAAGDVVVRDDLEVDRYNLVRPRELWVLLNPRPSGLEEPRTYGLRIKPRLHLPLLDDRALALPDDAEAGTPIVVYAVDEPRRIVEAEGATGQVIVAGDGEGLVAAGALGALDGDGVILYSAPYDETPGELRRLVASDADATLLVTDSNRRRAQRWTALSQIFGYTERAGEKPLRTDPADNRLPLFADASDAARTVVEQVGAAVGATSYGDILSYTPEDRPARALDGDVTTAWRAAGLAPAVGERIVVRLDEPVTTDQINLVQALTGPRDRFITRATLRFDVGAPLTVDLTDSSRTAEGQTVTFSERTFRTVEITVDDTNIGNRTDLFNNSLGFAEIRIRDQRPGATDVRIDEVVRMPVDLVDAVGADSADRRLVFVMTRSRTRLTQPRLGQDEPILVRELRVPTDRTFGVGGEARLAQDAPDEIVDAVVGLGPAGVSARSSARLPGSVRSRASSAFDGDDATAWTTPFGDATGQWVEISLPEAATVDHIDELGIVADGRHSVPTQVRIDAGGESRTIDLPAVPDGEPSNIARVPVAFAAMSGQTFRITVTAVRPVTTRDYITERPIQTPVALAGIELHGVEPVTFAAEVATGCRGDLLTVDGDPVSVEIVGDRAAAEDLRALEVRPCGATAAGGVSLTSGDHVLRAADGRTTGIDVDGVTFGSGAGGAALAVGAGGTVAPVEPEAAPPRVRVIDDDRTTITLRVSASDAPYWLVLGQSSNAGWTATIDGEDRGESTLVDGYANAWLVTPRDDGRPIEVTLEWTPQKVVWIGIAISGLAMLLCVALALGVVRSRRRAPAGAGDHLDEEPAAFAPPFGESSGALARGPLVGGAVAVAVTGFVFGRWWVGLLAGAAFALAAARPRLRWVLALSAAAALAVAGGYVLVQQYRIEYPQLLEWPIYFSRVHMVGWLAVVLLGADALLELLRRGGGRRRAQAVVVPGGSPATETAPS